MHSILDRPMSGASPMGRDVDGDRAGIQTHAKAPGFAENGKVGLRALVRADDALLFNGASAQNPFVIS
jgi:hypothetical protein